MPKKILVVDDEPNVLRLLAARLSAHNYEVVTASDGALALEKVKEAKPDLILLDINMPGEDGTTVFENLKAQDTARAVPVIFMTANPGEDIRQKVTQMGARDFIAKPFDSNNLLFKIKMALGEDDIDTKRLPGSELL